MDSSPPKGSMGMGTGFAAWLCVDTTLEFGAVDKPRYRLIVSVTPAEGPFTAYGSPKSSIVCPFITRDSVSEGSEMPVGVAEYPVGTPKGLRNGTGTAEFQSTVIPGTTALAMGLVPWPVGGVP